MMEHRFLLLLSLGYSLIATADSSGRCLFDWYRVNNACYQRRHWQTFAIAKAGCEKSTMNQSTLCTFMDAKDAEINIFGKDLHIAQWIGLTRDLTGKFTWVDGSPLTYTNWAPNEPSTNQQKGCAIRGRFTKKWAMRKCNYQYDHYCTAPTIDSSNRCLSGGEYYREFCYSAGYYNSGNPNYWCKHKQMKQSVIASILDEEESEFLSRKIVEKTWIGLKMDSAGKFTWVDGSTLSYTNWAPKEPDTNQQKRCVYVDFLSKKWHMGKCSFYYRTYCKAPAIAIL